MMQLEFGGRRYEIPARELAVGSDPSCELVLTGSEVKPRHAVVRCTADGSAIIQRASADADTLVNSVRLGAEPAPVLHGDRIQIGGNELLVVDSRKSGSTQFIDAAAIAGMTSSPGISARSGGPAPVKGGRLVCLTDGREYTIGTTLVFGREAGSDVVVESTQVSRRHAQIDASPEGYLLSDLSSNGTFVNGQRIQGKRTLARADMIRIADYEFRFYADAVPVPPPAAAPSPPSAAPPPVPPAPAVVPPPDLPPPLVPRSPVSHPMSSGPVIPPAGAQQRLNDTFHGQSFSKPAPPPEAAQAPRPTGPAPMASFLVRSGTLKGTRLPVRVPVANIGRAEYNDVVLADDSVSTAHAKLQRREGVWVLMDLGSTNGTFVDGEAVTGEVPLGPGVTVRFGQVSALFEPTDDTLGVAKGSGTRMMEPIKVPEAAPAPAAPAAAAPLPPPPIASAPRPTPPPKPQGPREPLSRPAPRRPPVVVTPPAKSSAAKWLLPVVIAAALAVIIFFMLRR